MSRHESPARYLNRSIERNDDMQMVMFVLDDPEHLEALLDGWQAVGVTGVTIIESSGLHRVRQRRLLGARYVFGALSESSRVKMEHYTLFAIVPDETTVRACLEAAEQIVGDLDGPNTGVLASWELTMAKGVLGKGNSTQE
jgi:hypothetical protein